MDRIKELQINKQNRIGFGRGTPNSRDGKNGDMVVRIVPQKGLFLFYKLNDIWYSAPLTKELHSNLERGMIVIPEKSSTEHGELVREEDSVFFRAHNGEHLKLYMPNDSVNFSKIVTTGDVTVGGDLTVSGGDILFDEITTSQSLTIKGGSGQGASIELWADEGAQNADKWQIESTADNKLEFYQNTASGWSSALMLANGGNVVVRDQLLIADVPAGDGSSEDMLVIDSGDNIVKKRTFAQSISDLGIDTKLPLAGGDMTGHLQITATDGSHSGSGAYVPSGTDWQNVLRLGSTSDNGINFLVNDAGTNKVSYYTNRWGSQHEWARGSENTGDGNTYQPMMRLASSDSNTYLQLYDGTTNSVNVRITSESSNDTYFNNSANNVAIGSTSAGGYKLKVTGTTHITGALTVDSTVDGRDLATDGSKLDGIEAGATADQTGPEIAAALNTDLGGNFYIGNQSDDMAIFSGAVKAVGTLFAYRQNYPQLALSDDNGTDKMYVGVSGEHAYIEFMDNEGAGAVNTLRFRGDDGTGSGDYSNADVMAINFANKRDGINTTSPGAALDVQGTGWASKGIRVKSTTTNGAVLELETTQRGFEIASRDNGFNIRDTDGDTSRFTISSGGNISFHSGAITSGEWQGTAIANSYVADLPTSKITSGTMADARIASSNVTQHQGDITGTGALNSGSITSGFGSIDIGADNLTVGDITCRKIATNLPAITSSANISTVQISQELNDTSGAGGAKYAQLELHIKETDVSQFDEGVNYIFCHNSSAAEAGGSGVTPKFQVSSAGAVTAASTVTSSNGVCSGTGALNTGSDNITTTGTVSAGTFNHFMDVKIHQWYTADANQDYIPFGGSQAESNSTADSLNDDTLFIAPYNGTLEKIVLQAAPGSLTVGGAGNTRIQLRVNGSNLTHVEQAVANETSVTFSWSANNSFSAGDRLRLSFDPTNTPKYVTATSVWKYTI